MKNLDEIRYIGLTSFSDWSGKCLNVHHIFYIVKPNKHRAIRIKATSPLGKRSVYYHNTEAEILDIIGQQLAKA